MNIWVVIGEGLTAFYTGSMATSDKKSEQTKTEPKPVPDVNVARWVANQFFEGGRSSHPRLDEIHNLTNPNVFAHCDTTDRNLAYSILNRAGLGDHWRIYDLIDLFANALNTIPNPTLWMNPDSPFQNESKNNDAA